MALPADRIVLIVGLTIIVIVVVMVVRVLTGRSASNIPLSGKKPENPTNSQSLAETGIRVDADGLRPFQPF